MLRGHWEHPTSAAATMNEDGCTLDVPTTGGEGKSAVVVGGGISGLTSAHYLLRACYKVVLLEGRESVGGNNEPYIDGANQEHATTCVFTQPSQQPHYAELCRNFGVAQVSHSMENVEGVVILDGRPIPVRMGVLRATRSCSGALFETPSHC